ncbi:MAG: hypothetical protein K2N26_02725, partial [Oscillospiraceae bacterium]|nr:hypothetical protein [Oscillospiraceae bacterium]
MFGEYGYIQGYKHKADVYVLALYPDVYRSDDSYEWRLLKICAGYKTPRKMNLPKTCHVILLFI